MCCLGLFLFHDQIQHPLLNSISLIPFFSSNNHDKPPRAIMSTTQDADTDNSYVSRPGHKHEPVQVIADEQARDEVKNNNQTNSTSSDQLGW